MYPRTSKLASSLKNKRKITIDDNPPASNEIKNKVNIKLKQYRIYYKITYKEINVRKY